MIFDIAAYDPASPSANGIYWVWHSPRLPLNMLNNFYYDKLAKKIPPKPNDLDPHMVYGGQTSYQGPASPDIWCCWYRIVNGGRDGHGRPGRFVILCAFARKSEIGKEDYRGILQSPLFRDFAENIPGIPVSRPQDLQLEFHGVPSEIDFFPDELKAPLPPPLSPPTAPIPPADERNALQDRGPRIEPPRRDNFPNYSNPVQPDYQHQTEPPAEPSSSIVMPIVMLFAGIGLGCLVGAVSVLAMSKSKEQIEHDAKEPLEATINRLTEDNDKWRKKDDQAKAEELKKANELAKVKAQAEADERKKAEDQAKLDEIRKEEAKSKADALKKTEQAKAEALKKEFEQAKLITQTKGEEVFKAVKSWIAGGAGAAVSRPNHDEIDTWRIWTKLDAAIKEFKDQHKN